jgi:hypothetical protein
MRMAERMQTLIARGTLHLVARADCPSSSQRTAARMPSEALLFVVNNSSSCVEPKSTASSATAATRVDDVVEPSGTPKPGT